MNKISLLIATFMLGSLALRCEVVVAGEVVRIVKTDVPSLQGGTVSDDMIDVTLMPSLALTPTVGGENQGVRKEEDSLRLGASNDGFGAKSTTGPQCATPTGPLPAPGWTLTAGANVPTCSYPYTSGFYSVCFGPNRYCFNQLTYTSFNNIPVGGTLRFCSVIGVPNGWSVIQVGLPSSCASSGEDWVMQHVSCVAGDTNCYPQSASISASPQTVTVPYGQSGGSTTISWNTVNYSNPCLWVQNSGGSTSLWSCPGPGAHNQVWPYVPSGGTSRIWISNGGSSSPSPEVAQVTVTGIAGVAPRISASPQTVHIPQGSTSGSTTISFDLTGSGYNAMCIWQSTNEEPPRVWHCEGGTRFSAVWPYVPLNGNTRMWLSPSSTSSTPVLASLTVTGVN